MVKIEKSVGFKCPDCDSLFLDKEDARDCCAPDIDELEVWTCPVCGELHEEKEDAKSCCK
jgi:uncharacterized C2H2 Zn-finger protein